jgi:hypothetical protein
MKVEMPGWRKRVTGLPRSQKQRRGSDAQDEGKNASASDKEDELSHEDNFVTITGSCE